MTITTVFQSNYSICVVVVDGTCSLFGVKLGVEHIYLHLQRLEACNTTLGSVNHMSNRPHVKGANGSDFGNCD